MSSFKIDLKKVEQHRSKHSQLTSSLTRAADTISAATYGVDPAIKARRQLQYRISYAAQRLRELEDRMYKVSDFMRSAIEQYDSSEGEIKGKINEIIGRHRRSWLESLFDGVGDAYNALTKWLESEDGKRFTEQAKANAVPPPNSCPPPEEPIDYMKFIGNIEWDYGDDGSIMNIGPEDKLIYIDENGDRKQVDYFKLQELLKVFNSQTGNLYQSGPIINPVLGGDQTDFYLYAMMNGYDPRTFQPITPADKEASLNYIIGRKMADEINRQTARAWESAFLDMLPYIGQVKSFVELAMGEDLLTGREYNGWDYGLGVTGGIFSSIKGGNKLFDLLKGMKGLDEAVIAGKVSEDIEKVVEGAANLKPQGLMDELASSGVKYNPNDVVAVTRNADGKLVWLENGSSQAGLTHILNHADDFAAKGISIGQLPEFITKAVSEGKIVGYQGKGTGRPIYEVNFNGQTQRVAVTTGSNGFIVGANPVSIK